MNPVDPFDTAIFFIYLILFIGMSLKRLAKINAYDLMGDPKIQAEKSLFTAFATSISFVITIGLLAFKVIPHSAFAFTLFIAITLLYGLIQVYANRYHHNFYEDGFITEKGFFPYEELMVCNVYPRKFTDDYRVKLEVKHKFSWSDTHHSNCVLSYESFQILEPMIKDKINFPSTPPDSQPQ